jgi:hypothetical protein
MSLKKAVAGSLLLMLAVAAPACAERWRNFAEDSDLKYYLDERSVNALPDNVFIFWVKSVAKDREYFKNEFSISNVAYQLTSYELDCAVSSYRVRGRLLFDKNRKELTKMVPETEPAFEPVPPESMLELAQEEICTREESDTLEAVPGPASPVAPPAPAVPAVPSVPEEPPTLQ